MSLKFYIPFCFLALLISCKDSAQKTLEDTNNSNKQPTQIITQTDIAKLKYIDFRLDTKAEKLIETWDAYTQLQQLIKNIKQAKFTELKDNNKVLKTLVNDLKRKSPTHLKSSPISARIMVLETKLFKLESLVNLPNINKKELGATIKELLLAFSNLNFQINKKMEKDSQKIEKPV